MKLEVSYPDSSQRFNMGGPYIGPLELNGETLALEFLDQNFVFDTDKRFYGFVRFNWREQKDKWFFGLFSWTSVHREFKILIYDPTKNEWLLSKETWTDLFLTKLTEGSIYYVEAFHNDSPELFPEKKIELNTDNFDLKTEKEIKTAHNKT